MMLTSELTELLASLDGIGTRDCCKWRNKIFQRCPLLALHLVPEYRRRAVEGGHVAANAWLREISGRIKIGRTPLNLGSDDDAISQYAESLAKNLSRIILPSLRPGMEMQTFELVRSAVARTGVAIELPQTSEDQDYSGLLQRFCDPAWWVRKFRTIQRRGFEGTVRELQGVCKARAIYVSELSFHRRFEQRGRNRALLEALEARNELDQVYTLADLADLGPSNPAIRRMELMTRMRGFEDVAMAAKDEHVGLFFTLTCPSKYHAAGVDGRRNKKFDGSSPLDAQRQLSGVWARVRAAWARSGIFPYGMRVAEPHHDGTPHWHILLFLPEELSKEAEEVFLRYALEEDGEEAGAQERRLVVERIDPDKGSATGYIAKYIAKNIDGFGVGEDSYGRDAVISALRIEAWASLWGIRQFQQIGGPGVTVWRELRRLEAAVDSLLEELRQAADAGEWSKYVELMGGPICKRGDRPLRPMMVQSETPNRYGESISSLKGILYNGLAVVTRLHVWVVTLKGVTAATAENDSDIGEAPIRGLPAGCAANDPDMGEVPIRGLPIGDAANDPHIGKDVAPRLSATRGRMEKGEACCKGVVFGA